MPDVLNWQKYNMDATVENARTVVYAVFDKVPGPVAVTRSPPGILLSFRNSADLLAIHPSGKVRWRRRLEAPLRALAVEGTAGGAFAALAGGLLYLIDAGGRPQWKMRVSGEVGCLSASEKGACAALGSAGGVACLSTQGSQLWSARLDAVPRALRLSQDGSTLVAVDESNHVSLVSREGKVLWKKNFLEGVTDFASTVACTRTLVLSRGLRNLSIDGSERWTAPVPDGTSAVRISEDGEAVYAVAPKAVSRILANGKVQWTIPVSCHPPGSSVIPNSRLLVLPSAEGTFILDKWGNNVLRCPTPGPLWAGPSAAYFDGQRSLFFIRESDSRTHLMVQDIGPSLVDYLLRASAALGEECSRIGQSSPFGEKHFAEAASAASAMDFGRALENAQFSYRYYEETLASIQHDTDKVVGADSLGRASVTARADLERSIRGRRKLSDIGCSCGRQIPVYSPERPLLVRCEGCGKLGLVP